VEKHEKNFKNFEKKNVSVSEKKFFGSDTDTETGHWFRFPIPKPGFGRTVERMRAGKKTSF
jgi:hypothetical protein